jgi:hypothetical protein
MATETSSTTANQGSCPAARSTKAFEKMSGTGFRSNRADFAAAGQYSVCAADQSMLPMKRAISQKPPA